MTFFQHSSPAARSAMQMLFSLPKTETRKTVSQKLTMRRAVAKWFWENMPPNGIGIDVSTRPASLKVDVAFVWSSLHKTTSSRLSVYQPTPTAVVICCQTRENCWPECTDAETILREITDLKAELERQEAEIRVKEPELRTSDMLFDEFASWDYSKSQSQAYHQNRHRLINLEAALFKGTRFARIDASQCSNLHYRAVPEGTLAPNELLEDWGLFSVNIETETATLVSEPKFHEIPPEMQMHLIQNMLFASARQVNDMLGLKFSDDGTLSFVRPPSIHHKPLNS